MKKFYFMTMLVIATLVSLTAQASTVYLQTDEASSGKITLVDTAHEMNLTLTSTAQAVNVPSDGGSFVLNVSDGFVFKCVHQEGASFDLIGDQSSKKLTSYNGGWGMFYTDGATYTITAVDGSTVQAKTVTFMGNDFYIKTYQYGSSQYPNNGKIGPIDYSSNISNIYMYANDGKRFKSIKDQEGNEYVTTPASSLTLPTSSFKLSEITLTVVTEEMYNSSFTLNITGEYYKVSLYEGTGNNTRSISSNNQVIKFATGDSFRMKNNYGGSFYKVMNGDTEIKKDASGYYAFTPQNGDVINVTIDYPVVEVPFIVTFTGDADASIISNMQYSGDYSKSFADLAAGNVKVFFGKTLHLAFNTGGFSNIEFKLNGESHAINASSPYYNFTIEDKNGYSLEIYGEKVKPFSVTVKTNDVEGLVIKNDNNIPYTLTGNESIISVDPGKIGLNISAVDGYYIKSVVASDPNAINVISNSYARVIKDGTIEITVAKIVRDREAVVFIENATNWNSNYHSFTISSQDRSLSQEFANFTPGYNFVEFGEFDDFYCNWRNIAYGSYVYLNGEKAALQYQSTYGCIMDPTDTNKVLTDFPDGSVIKIFANEPASYDVTYDIDEAANVMVRHDHITAIEEPSTHSVFHGTMIHITPVSTFDAASDGVKVMVNNVEQTANVDGEYAIEVTDHTNIAVKAVQTGVEDIDAAELGNVKTYNLQGVEVKGDRLPAGIYIRGGKKVVVK